MEELNDYITHRLFYCLEHSAINVLFDWHQMSEPVETYQDTIVALEHKQMSAIVDYDFWHEFISKSTSNDDILATSIIVNIVEYLNLVHEINNDLDIGIYYVSLQENPRNITTGSFRCSYILWGTFTKNENKYIKLSERTKIKKPKAFKY